jgi:hypothetical protein
MGDYSDFDVDDLTLGQAFGRLTAVEKLRITIGIAARGVLWLCFFFILGNAVFQAIDEGAILTAVIELAFFPLTVLIYPFAAHPDALAWPLAQGTSLVPALIVMVVAYPISTFVGGLPAVE